VGPIRVLPGRLSVCRTFGDPEAKLDYRGGNPNVVQSEPDIKVFSISKKHDFIALASDGIFDKMTNEDISNCVWLSCEAAKQVDNVHHFCGLGVEGILKNSLYRQSLDNVTVVMVAFRNFQRVVCGSSSNEVEKPATNQAHQTDTRCNRESYRSNERPSHAQNPQNQSKTRKDSSNEAKENNINFMNKKSAGAQ
jgi:serine/threonine protein phosphatase PrpC